MARPSPQSPAVVFHSVMPRRIFRPGAFSAIMLPATRHVRFHGREVLAAVMVRADVVDPRAGPLQQSGRRKRGQELDARVDGLHGLAEVGYALLIGLVAQLVADLPVRTP